MIKYFVDTTKDKQNKFTPGTKIPIYKYRQHDKNRTLTKKKTLNFFDKKLSIK